MSNSVQGGAREDRTVPCCTTEVYNQKQASLQVYMPFWVALLFILFGDAVYQSVVNK